MIGMQGGARGAKARCPSSQMEPCACTGSLTLRELGESAAGAVHPASCHNIIRDLEKLDGVQRGAASTIKGLGGIKGLIYEGR